VERQTGQNQTPGVEDFRRGHPQRGEEAMRRRSDE
jgi:hypothetical protein